MTKLVFTLHNDHIRQNAINAIMSVPLGKQVVIQDKNRSLEQNAIFHAICQDFADQAEHLGRKFTLLQWKHLIVSAHAIETKEPFEPIIGLAGEFLNIRESTADMGVRRKNSLIEFAFALGAEKGVRFREA